MQREVDLITTAIEYARQEDRKRIAELEVQLKAYQPKDFWSDATKSLVMRLRGIYAVGPNAAQMGPDDKPEFGWRGHGERPPIHYEAAQRISDLEAQLADLRLRSLPNVTLCEKCGGTQDDPKYPGCGCCAIGHSRQCQCALCQWRLRGYEQEKQLAERDAQLKAAREALTTIHAVTSPCRTEYGDSYIAGLARKALAALDGEVKS